MKRKPKDYKYREYVDRMIACSKDNDTERAHSMADNILTEFLSDLGYDELVEIYIKFEKWCA